MISLVAGDDITRRSSMCYDAGVFTCAAEVLLYQCVCVCVRSVRQHSILRALSCAAPRSTLPQEAAFTSCPITLRTESLIAPVTPHTHTHTRVRFVSHTRWSVHRSAMRTVPRSRLLLLLFLLLTFISVTCKGLTCGSNTLEFDSTFSELIYVSLLLSPLMMTFDEQVREPSQVSTPSVPLHANVLSV